MLNQSQLSVLLFLSAHDNGSASLKVLSDKFGPSIRYNLAVLLGSGDVSCGDYPQFVPDEVFSITSKGHQSLDDARRLSLLTRQKRAHQEADQALKEHLEDERRRKDARRSWVQWAITTVLSVLSFFTGAVTEVLTGFMQWILALFH